MANQITFFALLKQLLNTSIETNRCRAKLHRMNSNSSSYQEYARYVVDGNEQIASIWDSLKNGKYIAQSKEQELSAIEDVKRQAENYSWEIVLPSQNTTSTERQENTVSLEKKRLLEFLEALKDKINSGEQAEIEKSGQEESRREKEQQEYANLSKKQEELNKILQEAQELNQINGIDLTIEDYYSWKRKKTKLDKLKSWNDFQNSINEIQLILDEIEKKFPKQISIKAQAKKERKGYCSHGEIYWPTIFQINSKERPYCLNCGEDKNKEFCKALERWSIKEINQQLVNNNLKTWEFQAFLKKKNYFDIWNSLQTGSFTNDELDSLNLNLLQAQLEHIAITLLPEFAQEKGIKIDNNNNQEQREREQIQRDISDLEQKPNKTETEQRELEQKRKQLEQLDRNTNTNEPFNWKPLVIGSIICLVLGIIAYLFIRKRRKAGK